MTLEVTRIAFFAPFWKAITITLVCYAAAHLVAYLFIGSCPGELEGLTSSFGSVLHRIGSDRRPPYLILCGVVEYSSTGCLPACSAGTPCSEETNPTAAGTTDRAIARSCISYIGLPIHFSARFTRLNNCQAK